MEGNCDAHKHPPYTRKHAEFASAFGSCFWLVPEARFSGIQAQAPLSAKPNIGRWARLT